MNSLKFKLLCKDTSILVDMQIYKTETVFVETVTYPLPITHDNSFRPPWKHKINAHTSSIHRPITDGHLYPCYTIRIIVNYEL